MLPKVASHAARLASSSLAHGGTSGTHHSLRNAFHTPSSSGGTWKDSGFFDNNNGGSSYSRGGRSYGGGAERAFSSAGRAVSQANPSLGAGGGGDVWAVGGDEASESRTERKGKGGQVARRPSLSVFRLSKSGGKQVPKAVVVPRILRRASSTGVGAISNTKEEQEDPEPVQSRALSPPPPRAEVTEPESPTPALKSLSRFSSGSSPSRDPHAATAAVHTFLSSTPHPSLLECNAALLALFNTRQPGEPLTLLVDTYDAMIARSVLPDSRTYEILIRGLLERDWEVGRLVGVYGRRVGRNEMLGVEEGRLGEEGKRVEKLSAENNLDSAWGLLEAILAHPSSSKENAPVSTKVIMLFLRSLSFHADSNIKKTKRRTQLLTSLIDALPTSIPHPASMYRYLIQIHASLDDVNACERTFQKFQALCSASTTSAPTSTSILRPRLDTTQADHWRAEIMQTYNALLSAYFSLSSPSQTTYADRALDLLSSMMTSHPTSSSPSPGPVKHQPKETPPPSSSTFAVVVDGFCRMGDVKGGVRWFRKLLDSSSESGGKGRRLGPLEASREVGGPDGTCWGVMLEALAREALTSSEDADWAAQEITSLWPVYVDPATSPHPVKPYERTMLWRVCEARLGRLCGKGAGASGEVKELVDLVKSEVLPHSLSSSSSAGNANGEVFTALLDTSLGAGLPYSDAADLVASYVESVEFTGSGVKDNVERAVGRILRSLLLDSNEQVPDERPTIETAMSLLTSLHTVNPLALSNTSSSSSPPVVTEDIARAILRTYKEHRTRIVYERTADWDFVRAWTTREWSVLVEFAGAVSSSSSAGARQEEVGICDLLYDRYAHLGSNVGVLEDLSPVVKRRVVRAVVKEKRGDVREVGRVFLDVGEVVEEGLVGEIVREEEEARPATPMIREVEAGEVVLARETSPEEVAYDSISETMTTPPSSAFVETPPMPFVEAQPAFEYQYPAVPMQMQMEYVDAPPLQYFEQPQYYAYDPAMEYYDAYAYPPVANQASGGAFGTINIDYGHTSNIIRDLFDVRSSAPAQGTKDRDVVKAYETFLSFAERGTSPSVEVVAKLIEALGRLGTSEEVRERVRGVYGVAQDVLRASSLAQKKEEQRNAWFVLENAMVLALAHSGDMPNAHVHRARLLEFGGSPGADAYGALVLGTQGTTDDAQNALTLFAEARERGVQPNVYLYNNVISKLAKARKAELALGLFEQMRSPPVNLSPSSITYGAVIGALAKVGDVRGAEGLFSEMTGAKGFRGKGKTRVPPFNTMMQMYVSGAVAGGAQGQGGNGGPKEWRERAVWYFGYMREWGVVPSEHSYKLLLDAYALTDESTGLQIDEAMLTRTFEDIKRLSQDPKSAIKLTGAHFASMIKAHGEKARDMQRAIDIFDSVPSYITRTRSSSSLGKTEERKVDRDALVYEALFDVLALHGCVELYPAYLQTMKEDEVKMTAYVANSLIRGYAMNGRVQEARGVWEGMADVEGGRAAPGNHVEHKHRGSVGAGEQDGMEGVEGEKVYREPSTYAIMIEAEVRAGNEERAGELAEQARLRNYPIQVYNKMGVLDGFGDAASSSFYNNKMSTHGHRQPGWMEHHIPPTPSTSAAAQL